MKSAWCPIAAITVCLLSGCTRLGPDYAKPDVTMPMSWPSVETTAAQPGVPTLSQWRQDDGVLTQLYEMLEQNNHDLQVAALNFAASRLYQKQAASSGDPEVSFSGSVARQRLSEDGVSSRTISLFSTGDTQDSLIEALSSPYGVYSTGFDASWEPDLWGKVANQLRAADANAQMAEYELADLRLTLKTELTRQYLTLRAKQYMLSLRQQLLANLNAELAIHTVMVDSGVMSRQGLFAEQAQVKQVRILISALENEITQLQNSLSLLVGAQPGALSTLLDDNGVSLTVYDSPSLPLPSSILSHRPDVKATEEALKAATANIGLAEASLYPQFSLTGNAGVEALSSSTLSNWSSRTWTLGAGFYLPVFNRGVLHREVALTEITQQQAAIRFKQQVLKAWTEVDNAIRKVNRAREQYQLNQEALSLHEQQLTMVKAEYDAGVVNQLPLLAMENQFLTAQLDDIHSRLNYNLSQLMLYKAVASE
ncbi:efflux transporter outer membrane subunit [Alteromonas sp. C1M14]|uniref:efflux transporter outer membrane subunit n=1 Tax=Alteromonas sp. C1M14 TaxID=2841567 RepID=UPI001C09D0B7|nr:efflux transporter outer membrane subunit [Alteromonas sp. C1M14]MBU2977780.1 efflux transporter outer membrane subunit [Alteromonas sp. C1M14]